MNNTVLAEARISIIGLGLIGGSLAMALRGKCKELYGYDTDPEAIAFAEQFGIVDQASTESDEILPKSNIIILAVPVRNILQIVSDLPALHSGNAIVMDIGSTKREIVTAFEKLPARFDPIGGHPMCGKEDLTISNADPNLFVGASFAFTPLARTTEKARNFSKELAMVVGAHPRWIDAPTHDSWAAATSHLPFLLSLSLALSTPQNVSSLVGPGFKSVVRLAGTPGSIMVDILQTNQDEILKTCARFSEQLGEIITHIQASDFEKMAELIEEGRAKREALVEVGKQ